MQIQPHFLFNVHHAINGLILQQENNKASRMLTALSDLLRVALEQQQQELIPLEEELQMTGHYLSIQQIRFGDRFTYSCSIDDAARKILVPYFILQPLVENAVIHGIEQTDEDAILQIKAEITQQALYICIRNTGRLQPGNHKGMGIGLSNVTERLKQYYHHRASFRLAEQPGGTIEAQIIIPVS